MWQYQIDEDHFYDLRDLPVGGWLGAKLTRQADGKWASFSAPHRRVPYNTAHPINYDKRYIPPCTSLDHALPPIVPTPEIPEFEVNRHSLTSLNELDAIHNPPVFEMTSPTRPRTSAQGSLRDRAMSSVRTRPQTAIPRESPEPLVNVRVLENTDLPDREIIWSKVHGTPTGGRSPFRVSQYELRRQFKLDQQRMQNGRPATTSALRRIPNVSNVYGRD
jgi:hypothetical protein